MQYVFSVPRWAVAAVEGEFCAGRVAAGKNTPASTMLIEVSARGRTMCRSLPRQQVTQQRRLHQAMPPYKRFVLQFWPQMTLVCSLERSLSSARNRMLNHLSALQAMHFPDSLAFVRSVCIALIALGFTS